MGMGNEDNIIVEISDSLIIGPLMDKIKRKNEHIQILEDRLKQVEGDYRLLTEVNGKLLKEIVNLQKEINKLTIEVEKIHTRSEILDL